MTHYITTFSHWSIFTSFSLFNLAISAASYLHNFQFSVYGLTISLVLTVFVMILWFRDVITEFTYLGDHTLQVQKGIFLGMILFVIIEAFAFLSIFWAYFHSSLSSSGEIGNSWSPQIIIIVPIEYILIPLLNTLLVLTICLMIKICKYVYPFLNKICYRLLLRVILSPYILASFPMHSPILQEVYRGGRDPFGGHVSLMEFDIRTTVISGTEPNEIRSVVNSRITLEHDIISRKVYRLLEGVKSLANHSSDESNGYDTDYTESCLELLEGTLQYADSYTTPEELASDPSNAISARDLDAEQWNILNEYHYSFTDFLSEYDFSTNRLNITDWIANMATNEPALYTAHVLMTGIDHAYLVIPHFFL